MEKAEIHAVEMTREIRARHAETLGDATSAERIRFYREKAEQLKGEIEAFRRESKASA